jgi:hypothetical protein
VSSEPAVASRVLSIGGEEAFYRLGPHVQKSNVSFRWAGGEREVKLSENRLVELGPGGDFHVKIENDERQGMEWYRVANVSYAGPRYAQVRERLRDRGSSSHVLESGYAALDTFQDVMHGALRLTPAGEATVAGRPALKFTASLGQVRVAPEGARLPKVEYPKNGPDPDTAMRLAAAEKSVPKAVSGTLVLDRETAVPLQAHLKGESALDGAGGTAKLTLSVDLDVAGVGQDPKIAVPAHLPDEPRRPGVVAALGAYGISRASDDGDGGTGGAGVAPDTAPDEDGE